MKEMSESTKKTLTIVCSILLIIAAACPVYAFFAKLGWGFVREMIIDIMGFVATMFALFYVSMGYKKNAALAYKLFLWVFAVALLARIACTSSRVVATLAAVGLVFIVVLATYQNLGNAKSTWIGLGLMATQLACLIINIVLKVGPLSIVVAVDFLILSVVTWVLIFAKYADKEARGTT